MKGFIERDGGKRKDSLLHVFCFICFAVVKTVPENVTT